jgi:hypothetical protein
VKVPFQEGTRHSILTALSGALPERVLQAFSRHRDHRSLSHYAKPRPSRATIVEALRHQRLGPRRTHARARPEKRPSISSSHGGADGTRTCPECVQPTEITSLSISRSVCPVCVRTPTRRFRLPRLRVARLKRSFPNRGATSRVRRNLLTSSPARHVSTASSSS